MVSSQGTHDAPQPVRSPSWARPTPSFAVDGAIVKEEMKKSRASTEGGPNTPPGRARAS
jgi:hypothetical protein